MKFTLLVLCCIIPFIYGRSDRIFRVVGGQDAQIGVAPHMCALLAGASRTSYSLCGGAIIAKKWILTAAHCIEGNFPQLSRVLVGTNHLDDSDTARHEPTRRYHPVNKWIGHQHYCGRRIVNDIAVVQVKEDFVFSNGVKPIPLSKTDVPGGKTAQITGWGRTHGDGQASKRLQILNLTTVSVADCKRKFPNSDAQQLCTYAQDGATCKGDSGGPLVLNGEVVGIVSYGVVGCPRGYENVFARVSSYAPWITEQISRN